MLWFAECPVCFAIVPTSSFRSRVLHQQCRMLKAACRKFFFNRKLVFHQRTDVKTPLCSGSEKDSRVCELWLGHWRDNIHMYGAFSSSKQSARNSVYKYYVKSGTFQSKLDTSLERNWTFSRSSLFMKDEKVFLLGTFTLPFLAGVYWRSPAQKGEYSVQDFTFFILQKKTINKDLF